ncbi:hypothetical protein [Roseivirga seohaensis]|uniref:hypothetical protein n=1 Tax=Roseivirga seohaensis TaxID=1914963 RepID=UPI003BA85490
MITYYEIENKPANEGLGIASAWITGGSSIITNLIGGNQAKKQAERDRANLLLQQQIAAENNQAALDLEQLRFQNTQDQLRLSHIAVPPKEGNTNIGLIIGGILVLGIGAAIALGGRDNNKSLNGLVETMD